MMYNNDNDSDNNVDDDDDDQSIKNKLLISFFGILLR